MLVKTTENKTPMTVAKLNEEWRSHTAMEAIRFTALNFSSERLAVTSSFGNESAVLLHLVSLVNKNIPVLFIDTEKHFRATLDYRDTLAKFFGLTSIKIITPSAQDLLTKDPDGTLHLRDVDACCDIRKVVPLEQALSNIDAWITGRKRYQNADREDIPIFENARVGKIKVNPLANWNMHDVQHYMKVHDLPTHPLIDEGYMSIGCEVCTTPVAEGEDPRSGRWRGEEKTECGIHLTGDGRFVKKV